MLAGGWSGWLVSDVQICFLCIFVMLSQWPGVFIHLYIHCAHNTTGTKEILVEWNLSSKWACIGYVEIGDHKFCPVIYKHNQSQMRGKLNLLLFCMSPIQKLATVYQSIIIHTDQPVWVLQRNRTKSVVVIALSLSRVQLSVTTRTAAHQTPQSFTVSWNLLKLNRFVLKNWLMQWWRLRSPTIWRPRNASGVVPVWVQRPDNWRTNGINSSPRLEAWEQGASMV